MAAYRADADLLRDLGLIVDVDLVEVDAGDLVGELLEDRRDCAARAAPRCPEVDKDGLVRGDLGTPSAAGRAGIRELGIQSP